MEKLMGTKKKRGLLLLIALMLTISMAACGSVKESSSGSVVEEEALTEDDITINDTIENTNGGENAILIDGEEKSYENTKVVKSGDTDDSNADFTGTNAAILTENGGTANLADMVIKSDGKHANAVFAYGEGTTVNIEHSIIETTGDGSGGLMTTGGATLNASDLTIHTTGGSSAAIRSDRGGGTVTVKGGNYTAEGSGSPAIYSTADITVSDANLTSTAAQGVVIEGKNSVTLKDADLTADNNKQNSDNSDYYQAIMIYQSMSGDATEGTSEFSMTGGSIVNKNGDIFFVNNCITKIALEDAKITNGDEDGVFLRAAAAGWGNDGSNGGHVTLNAKNQKIKGDMIVDDISTLNLYLKEASEFEGAINPDGEAGDVYVELKGESKWALTGDSYVTSLTCDKDSIDLNGHKLYVNGKEYKEGSASSGEAVEVPESATQSTGGGSGDNPPDMPSGGGSGGEPPEKPSGSQ